MRKSIFGRLLAIYTVIIVLIFAILTCVMVYFTRMSAVDLQYDAIVKISNILSYDTVRMQVENDEDQRSRQAYRQMLNMWSEFSHSDITCVNMDGEITISSNPEIDSVPEKYIEKVKENTIVKAKGTFGDHYDERVLTIGIPLMYNGNQVGALFFNTRMPQIYLVVTDLLYVLLASILIALIVMFILVYIQSKKISKPIRQINSAVMDIASGDFSKRVKITSNDEIGQLASSFNFMADSIEHLESQRTEFISNVSHELRTPMTSITGFVGGILDGTVPKEKQEEYLKIVYNESSRLTRMVNDMLEMSKMNSPEYKLDITEFNFTELVCQCVIQLEQRINEKRLDLNADFPDDALNVLGDRDAISRVIINLMDNAVKFSYSGTTINVRLWQDKSKAYFSIGNFGDGLDGNELKSVFDRFYKTDKSRAKDKSGAGLGLSLVKNILIHHQQSIWVESDYVKESSDIRYTTFTFTLQLA